jgi:hypothetical protein
MDVELDYLPNSPFSRTRASAAEINKAIEYYNLKIRSCPHAIAKATNGEATPKPVCNSFRSMRGCA